MTTSLHLSSLLETKKQIHFRNVMGAIAFSCKPNPAAAQYLLMPVARRFRCCLLQERCFAVNVEHADSHRHVETNGRSAVTPESDNDGYSALMLNCELLINQYPLQ